MVLFPTVLRRARPPTPGSPRLRTRQLRGQPPGRRDQRWSQVRPSQNSPRGPRGRFLLTSAAGALSSRTAGGDEAARPFSSRSAVAHQGSGSLSCVWQRLSAFSVCCSAVAAGALLPPLVSWPPRLLIPSSHVYADKMHHPKGVTSPYSASVLPDTRLAGVWRV